MLKTNFFQRPTLIVARDLLGKFLVRKHQGKITKYLITEVEAYDGVADLASHASRGRTRRTETMFQSGGVWYVYLCYGTHWMLNIVTGERDYPAAVLLRGVRGINGPGRLTKILNITDELNNQPAHPSSGLCFEDSRIEILKSEIVTSPRVGVAYAGPIWSQKPWRFRLK